MRARYVKCNDINKEYIRKLYMEIDKIDREIDKILSLCYVRARARAPTTVSQSTKCISEKNRAKMKDEERDVKITAVYSPRLNTKICPRNGSYL